jgi:hypothetical protein
MHFEWDGSKAASNFKKDRVSFDEAVTVFYDPLAATFGDPDHSREETRLITVGYSARGWLLVVSHVERAGTARLISARRATLREGNVMKTKHPVQADDLRSEYNFDYSTAVRGKYYRRLIREGANVAILEPDVAKEFRSSAAVNEALRSLLRISATTRRLTRLAGGRDASPRR